MAQPSAQEYEILKQFQELTEEHNSIANKIAELETDKREHEYVFAMMNTTTTTIFFEFCDAIQIWYVSLECNYNLNIHPWSHYGGGISEVKRWSVMPPKHHINVWINHNYKSINHSTIIILKNDIVHTYLVNAWYLHTSSSIFFHFVVVN